MGHENEDVLFYDLSNLPRANFISATDNSIEQWFSKFSMHQDHMKGL